MTRPKTMREVCDRIDKMAEAIELSDQVITALAVECKNLRRKLADREGQIEALNARLVAAGGRQR